MRGGDGFPRSDELERLTNAFRLLSDPGRLRLVVALLNDRELPVHKLASAASLSMTAASQQLRVLRDAGVVRRRRDGRRAFNGSQAATRAHSPVTPSTAPPHAAATRERRF